MDEEKGDEEGEEERRDSKRFISSSVRSDGRAWLGRDCEEGRNEDRDEEVEGKSSGEIVG
jgi:hypothetical protein